ncbi:MAG TPA: ABC transporter substrate-binding protein [Thiobacillaceae bacterium]|nr:ABC transporter substrate-binding protein [Thiobacillaceae bacterium]HNU62954.1 ABC transporter substrate-binding protein [Thiobacillaceae bacterium]
MRSLLRLLPAFPALLLAACTEPPNNPYPAGQSRQSVLYSAFSERPKHLDPARSYSENEYVFIGNIYEPALQYHFLKRPYVLEPLTLTAMPQVRYLDAQGQQVRADGPVSFSEYELRLQPGIRYQPHPAFAKRPDGRPRYVPMDPAELADIERFTQFHETGTRELTAADYAFQIRRLADPRVQSPLLGFMLDYIVGLEALSQAIGEEAKRGARERFIDLERFEFPGVTVVDRYTWRIRIHGKYPQFQYWLAMPFFAPVPREAERFYRQPGMAEKNFTLDWQPVGTGAYYLAENDPNRVMLLRRNPHYHEDYFPAGHPDAGKRLPMVDEVIYSLEKENVPYWNKFLQGYYDASGVSSDSFDQAIRIGADGNPDLTPDMRARGIRLSTSVRTSNWYLGFNMLDPVLGGLAERQRKLRQALSIALDFEEYISIFLNGRGLPGQGPLPPGIFGAREGKAGINPVVYTWDGKQARRRPLADARRLLAEAGYPGGRDARTGEPLTLYLDTMDSGPEAKSRLDWYRKQFARLDIQLVVRSTDYNRFQDKMRKGNAQMFEWGWNADYPDPENFLFLLYGPNRKVGNNGENAANYQNPAFDRLFEQIKEMENGPARQALIDEMVHIVREDAPWVFAYYPKSFALRHGWVMNAEPNLMAHNQLKYRRVDGAARAAYQQRWNRPVWWPLVLSLALLVTAIWPVAASYRKHLRAAARA